MANLKKIKNGGSGTLLGNYLRNVVNPKGTSNYINTPSVPKQSISPGAGYLGTGPGNQTMVPNASIAPKKGAVYTSGPYQNMSPIPQGPSLSGGMSLVPPKPTGAVYTSGPNQNITPSPTVYQNQSLYGSNPNIIQYNTGVANRTSGGSTTSTSRTTGGGTTSAGTGSLATPNGAATIGSSDFNYSKTPQQIAEEEALRRVQDYNDQQSQQDTNYENIMRDTLRQFQGEIDATNQVYADKLRVAGIQGQNRLGQQRAEDFNSGATNSSFANAAQDRTQAYNTDVTSGIQAQKLQSLAQIENSARELGNKYYEQKKAAKESGLAGYLDNIKSAGTQKEAIAQDIATSIFNGGLTVDEISPAKLESIAKNAGVPLQQIKNTFTAVKKAYEKEALTSTSKSASVQEYEYAKQNGYTGSFTDYQNEDANRKAVSSGSSSGGLTPYQQFQATQSIAKDTQKRTENAREMSRQANMISSGYNAIVSSKDKKNRSLQTQAIITSFNKILDPTSVVRESEYDRTSAGQSLLQRLEGKVNNIAQGGAGVTDATLKEASDIAKEYLKNSQASVLAENQRAVAMANQFGLNSDFVTTSYSGGGNSGSGGGGLYDF